MQKIIDPNHIIYHADACEILQNHIEDESIDLIFADPPYNIGKQFNGKRYRLSEPKYLAWCYEWLDLCVKKLKPHGSFYLMCSTQFMPFLDVFLRDKLTILSRIVWYYDSSGVQAKKRFGSLYEPILFCVKDAKNYTFHRDEILVEAKTGAKRKLIDYRKNPPQPYNSHKLPGNVWEFPRVRYMMPEYEKHPTQKPMKLLERIVKVSSSEGDVILDPFAGSFTTAVVAKQLGRKSISIEQEAAYVEIGQRRLGEV